MHVMIRAYILALRIYVHEILAFIHTYILVFGQTIIQPFRECMYLYVIYEKARSGVDET